MPPPGAARQAAKRETPATRWAGRPRSGQPAQHLVDGNEAGLEVLPSSTEVQPPYAKPLLPDEPGGLDTLGVEPPGPVAQRLDVVRPEALDVLGHEAGALEGQEHPRQGQRVGVGEHVAGCEGAGPGLVEAGNAVVEQTASR